MDKKEVILIMRDIMDDYYKKYKNVGHANCCGFRPFYQYIHDKAREIENN